jgi:phosphatidylinositol-4,5-bisphosphate 3-kinase
LGPDEKAQLWANRDELRDDPKFLALVLQSLDSANPGDVAEVDALLAGWSKPAPHDVLLLLSAEFADARVREYAVNHLGRLGDEELLLFLPQLSQARAFELYDDSPLACFLVFRGLREPRLIGHRLFWPLISEVHVSHIQRRFSAILVNFAYGYAVDRDELLAGYRFTRDLAAIHEKIHGAVGKEATVRLREALISR